MERLKHMKETLFNRVEAEMGKGLESIDTKELGEAIDMIKDMSEAMYYCSIVEAMEEKAKEEKYMEKYYSPMMMRQYPPMYYDGGRMYNEGGGQGGNSGGGRSNYDGNRMMYYNGNSGNSGGNRGGGDGNRGGGSRGYSEDYYPYPMEIRDYREGKSPVSRRNYMESKELKHDKTKQMQELDKYVQELTEDVLEMIHDATPEEKLSLSQKMTALANKIR